MAAAGDILAEALTSHRRLIAHIVAASEADTALREDLHQEVALALWRAMPAWRGDCSLRSFVARVAHNVCVSHVRRAVREPRRVALDDALPAPPSETAENEDLGVRLAAAVYDLPPGLRAVATLKLEGFSSEEIAQTLGISVGAVFTRVNRAKAALRAAMVMP